MMTLKINIKKRNSFLENWKNVKMKIKIFLLKSQKLKSLWYVIIIFIINNIIIPILNKN